MSTAKPLTYVRAWLALGRVSSLPTVWSNCLAGWWLGGGGNAEELPLLFVGTTFLYLGGAFLNDAFDVEFDQEHRQERPIPSGLVGLRTAWKWGLMWLVLGALSLFWLENVTGGLGLALVVAIVLYNSTHKLVPYAPVLMGLCRFLVYLLSASAGYRGVTGGSIWCGLALAAYVAGVRYVARLQGKSRPAAWPALLLVVPAALALIMNAGIYRESGLLLSAVLLLWVLRCLRPVFWSTEGNVEKATRGLVAGIVFVDWLAVAYAPRELGAIFIGLFLSTLLFQRLATGTRRDTPPAEAKAA